MGWFQSRADVLAMKATVDSTDFFPDLGHFLLELPLGGKSFFSSSILLHILRKKSLFIYLFKKNCVCVCKTDKSQFIQECTLFLYQNT